MIILSLYVSIQNYNKGELVDEKLIVKKTILAAWFDYHDDGCCSMLWR